MQTAWFVKTDNREFFFVPHKLKGNLKEGDAVKALVVESYDKKYNKKSWVCTSITKTE